MRIEKVEDVEQSGVLGESTHVKLGFIIAFLGLCAGGLGVWIWWAATINSKLDMMLTHEQSTMQAIQQIQKDVNDLESWRKVVDTVGTPTVSPRLSQLEKDMDKLTKDLELHIATTQRR